MRYRQKAINMKFYRQMGIAIVCVAMMLSAVGTFFIVRDYKNDDIEELKQQIIAIQENRDTAVARVIASNNELHDINQKLNDEVKFWEEKANEDREAEIVDFKKLKHYSYLFENALPESDITVDLILYVDRVCQEYNVNPDWMWGIYWRETKWQTRLDNPKSTARGLGQLLESTGRSYYENVFNRGTYNHSMAYDPYLNAEITIAMIGMNHKTSMQNALLLYTGGDPHALNTISNLMKGFGVTINESNRFYPEGR